MIRERHHGRTASMGWPARCGQVAQKRADGHPPSQPSPSPTAPHLVALLKSSASGEETRPALPRAQQTAHGGIELRESDQRRPRRPDPGLRTVAAQTNTTGAPSLESPSGGYSGRSRSETRHQWCHTTGDKRYPVSDSQRQKTVESRSRMWPNRIGRMGVSNIRIRASDTSLVRRYGKP